MFKYSKGLIERLLDSGLSLDDFFEYSSSTPSTNHTGPNNIFDYNKETYLETQKPNHFFKFSFKDSAVTVVAYKITSCYVQSGSHLRSWHFYGSNDDSTWELIDYVPDDSKLNGPYYSAAYHVPQQKGPFKYFLFNNVTNYLVLNKILLADFDIYSGEMLVHHHKRGCKVVLS